MVQSQYKLYYFDTRGAAEPVRLLLNYVKQPFEDVRLDYYNEWPAQKSSTILRIFEGKINLFLYRIFLWKTACAGN
jgi:hypothetical protein